MPSIVERSVRTLALAIATTRRPSHGGKNGAKPGIYYRTPSHTVRTVPYGVLFTARQSRPADIGQGCRELGGWGPVEDVAEGPTAGHLYCCRQQSLASSVPAFLSPAD